MPEESADADASVLGERYRLDGEVPIGVGGMGEVWRGWDLLLDRRVAVKRIRIGHLDSESGEVTRQRTLREARIAARLHHPHAVSVFDVITQGGELWLVLEYLPSLSTDKLLHGGPLPPEEVARIGAQVADALAAAHAAGIQHRDVKPGNVLVTETGWVKLTDFGIAHATGDPDLTGTGLITGSPPYLATEVARGEDSTPASDVYMLGATLYTLVEGAPPFGTGTGEPPLRLVHRIAAGPVPAPQRAGPLTGVLMRMLSPTPAARPDAATARDLLNQIAYAQRPTPLVSTTPPPGPTGPPANLTGPPLGLAGPPGASGPFGPPARGRRRWHHRPGVLVPLTVLMAGAVAGALLLPRLSGEPTPPAPVVSVGEPYNLSQCQVIDQPMLGRFGQVTDFGSTYYHSCRVYLNLPDNRPATVSSAYFNPQATPPAGTPEPLGELTLYRLNAQTQCVRTIRWPDGNTLELNAASANPQPELCPIADATLDAAMRMISTGGLPRVDTMGDANSLRRQDACQLLDAGALRAVPGLDAGRQIPAFGNWSCRWGAGTSAEPRPPSVDVTFRQQAQPPKPYGEQTTLGGRTAYVYLRAGQNGQNTCGSDIMHRNDQGERLVEMVTVEVNLIMPADGVCQLARDLGAALVSKLPPQ